MASTTESSSPPQEASLRNPFDPDINTPPRNRLHERINKRRSIEENQDRSLIHGFELRQHAERFLLSNDLSSLQEAIDEYSQTRNQSLFTIFKSFTLHYPNAFSFKLIKILKLQPNLQRRSQTVDLLKVEFKNPTSRMCSIILTALKNPLLYSLKVESEEILFRSLCEMIALFTERLYIFSLGGWEELLEYVCDCITGDEKLENQKGLMMLMEFPVNVFQDREFWLNQGNLYRVVLSISKYVSSMDQELKALAYDSSISLILLSNDFLKNEVSNSLLRNLLNIIDQHGEEEVLVNRINRLWELVKLDDGSIFMGKHGEVFWCMIRVAEVEDVSEELKIVSFNVIKDLYDGNVITNLSREELKRVLVVAINMLSCIVDDPLWYDVDHENRLTAGMADAYYRGVFLCNALCFDGDQGVFVPMAIETITMNYASNLDWKLRHAAIFTIGWIAEINFKGDMIQYFDQVASLVLKLLDDLNPRVLWATMQAINCLSEYKDQLMLAEYHLKFLAKLVPISISNSCTCLQLYAVTAIHSLVKQCGLDKISTFGEPIIESLLVLLKHEKQKIQVEAIDTLKSFAVLTPETFRQNYYETTVEALKVIVFDEHSLPGPLISAKCLECMVYLVRKVGPDNFKEQEADLVMESLISLDGKLSNTEYLAKCIIVQALDQICRCPSVSIDKFIHKLVLMLLGSTQPHLDLAVDKFKDDNDKHLVETMIVQACNTFSYCAVRSSIKFSLHTGKVTAMFVRLLGCSSFQIRKASILGLPNLLLSLKVADKKIDAKRGLTFFVVQALLEALKKETDKGFFLNKTDKVFYTIVLRILARCIQTSSSFVNDQLIKVIADGINDTARKIIKIEIEKAQEVVASEDRCESLPTEDTLQEVANLIATTIDTLRDRFILHVDDLMSNAVVFLADDNPDRPIAFAISIFNVTFPLFPDKLPP
ncbi:importin-like protein [Medicago truncatula]|uniref:Importin-like protein n=1 Tax=Medicago truncatula TaxID=3880 RepID=G7J8P7_MEDTR|nr:importin-like protein [Medicago truncatula]